VGVMVAPVIPGLNDHELPAILEAAYEAGARTAGCITLRLPHAVSSLFEEWLTAHFPDRKAKVLGRIREVRNGKLNDPRFGSRLKGEGKYAEHIRALFEVTCAKIGYDRERRPLSTAAWRGPGVGTRGREVPGPQLALF
jgi:DNA repair photolyase